MQYNFYFAYIKVLWCGAIIFSIYRPHPIIIRTTNNVPTKTSRSVCIYIFSHSIDLFHFHTMLYINVYTLFPPFSSHAAVIFFFTFSSKFCLLYILILSKCKWIGLSRFVILIYYIRIIIQWKMYYGWVKEIEKTKKNKFINFSTLSKWTYEIVLTL